MCTTNDAEKRKPKPLPTIPPYGEYAVEIENMTFGYSTETFAGVSKMGDNLILNSLDLKLPTGSRCLLIGANGSGKSTLLRILAGKHLTKSENPVNGKKSITKVLGLSAFHDTRLNFHRTSLDCDWGMRTVAFVGCSVPLMADIAVNKMMEKLQNEYPERRDELVDLLSIDLNWRMHQLSDGQRRRVQIMMGLLRPFKILLLDEVTTSLDVCVRQDLLRWLIKESDERGATIIYATHIFDGLDDWASHLFYLTNKGDCGWQGKMSELDYYAKLKEQNHPCKMLAIAEHWLRKELEEMRKERRHEKAHGEMAHVADPTDRQGGYASGRLGKSG